MRKKELLSNLMKEAHSLGRTSGLNKSEALKKAWQLQKLYTRLREGIVRFHFYKTDGTLRQARGTLHTNYLPGKSTNTRSKTNPQQMIYFDTDKNGFRSFKKSNLLP
ncbi:MAG: SH3 beta-barrel fold-containing protein [Bacteroides sp.]|nr:SH3 beta-barrel fold-containing protein [Bacteroides sp.]